MEEYGYFTSLYVCMHLQNKCISLMEMQYFPRTWDRMVGRCEGERSHDPEFSYMYVIVWDRM